MENVASGPHGLAAEAGKTGTIVWTMRSPYVFVGGRIEAEGSGRSKFFISHRRRQDVAVPQGTTWTGSSPSWDRRGTSISSSANWRRRRRLQKAGDHQRPADGALGAAGDGGGRKRLHLHATRAAGERKVRITHEWVERSASKPPAAPPGAVNPPDGGESDGTDIVFQWTAAEVPDGGKIGDYQFELSSRADMKLPLSMDFYKLISRTADATTERDKDGSIASATVKSQYTLALPGLLTPDRKYYWHVRAMNDKGVWGPWSKTWSFTARGLAYPLDVTLDYDQAKGVGILKWKANPVGKKPAKYRVYGSDEKGFTIADQSVPEHRRRDQGGNGGLEPLVPGELHRRDHGHGTGGDGPRRLLARSQQDLLPRGGGGRTGQAQRAVRLRDGPAARDLQQARGGQPRSAPSTATRSRANRSLGDLSARMKGDDQVSGYFDIEKPRFALDQGPAWLKIDEATGVLSGTPDAAGKVQVAVTATIDRQVRKLDEKALVWGNEKVLATTTERVGTATQRFVIHVQ